MAEFPIFEASKLEIRRSGGMRILSRAVQLWQHGDDPRPWPRPQRAL